uniref:RING finger protein 17 n=1 Tax=Anopheles maculatus TaxID=74869 RepID=A0A182T723_9DIPT
MTRVCLENLMRTDRPLMWLPEPTCDLCSLPFASYSDGREDRLPLLLSCGHLLCGPCVLKHAQGESIQCDRCNKEVSVPNNYGNVLMALHPSLYMLGRMSRMQQELEVIELYCLNEDPKAQEAKEAVHANEMPESYYIESLSANDLKAPKQLINLLECAFDAHERSTFAYQKRAQSYPNNVDHVIKKVTAHFLNLHNALQIEEERVLKQVRKAYLEQRQHTEHQQQHLIAVKERLKKLHTRVKHLKRDSPVSDEKSWLKLSEEVKRYLETEPLKLLKNNSPIPFTSFYPEGDKVLKNIRKSYRLTVPDYRTPLLPFAATRKKQKNDSDLLTSVNEEENRSAAATPTTSRESAPSERRNHRDGRKASKLSDKSMYSSVSRRDKKSSKSGFKYAQRVSLNAARKEELARCFSTVTITCIVNPHEIYVQDDLHNVATKALIELCQTEAEEYEAILLTAKCHLHVEAGKLYLVQPASSDSWYRARVLEVLNGTETTPEHSLVTYKVQYIDFGGKDTVLHEQIRPITDDLAQIDSKAMKCSLYGIASPEYDSDEGETRWPEECHQLMTDFVGNRKMLMYELDSSAADCFIVDFFHLPLTSSSTSALAAAVNDTINVTCWEGCYAPMSLRKTLINLQQCLEELQEDLNPEAFNRLQLLDAWLMNAAEEAKKRCTIPPARELKEYDLFDVHITHSKSPDCLYIMPMEWKKDRFDKLQEELDALCQQPSVYKVFPPYVGLVCGFSLAAQDQSRVWLRGRVTKLVPGICEMFALDTGETMIVRCEDLHLFPPASGPMCEYPLAVCCRLEHIHPKHVDGGGAGCFSSWSAEAVDEFNMLMKSKTLPFAAKVGSLWKESGVYSVLLYLRNKSDVDTCINKMLVKQGHAECNLGKEAEIADLAHKMELDDTATVGGNVSVLSRKVIDPRVPIDVLRVVTPDEIYVRLSSRKADLDGLHQTIQQHMDEVFDGEAGETEDSSTGWQVGDICLVFASPPDGSSIEWYRARIIDVPEEGELYEAFLIDSALKVQVHRTNVARMVPRIAQLQPGAVRCQLACIEPVKSSKHWSKVAVDALIGIIHSYETHAISLDVKRPPKAAEDNLPDVTRSLSVVLWGVRVSVRQALAPQKTEYRNINQLLAVRGMAHLSGTFRIFATKGDGAREELQSIEEAVEKMTLCEYEKLQQFFRTVAADSTEAERFGARENGNETAEVVLTTKSVDTEAVRVEIDGACASVLSLAKHKVESITEWPAGDPINKTVFVGMPTHIGNDGTVFLYDMSREPVLHHIRDMINEHMQNTAGDSRKTDVFKPGEPCLAKYHLDGLFYRATIVSVHKGNKYRVLFVDYGNEEACRGQNLRKDIICGRVPVQTNRFRLTGIAPTQASAKGGKSSWPEDAIMACHGLCVQQPCTVRVDTSIWSADQQQDSAIRLPIPCKLVRLKDSVDVISTLLDLGVFQYCREKTVEYDKCNVVRPASRRYNPIAYPMTSVDQGPSRLLPLCTPEERDLMQFMQDIETSIQIDRISKDFEDPNEIPDDTGVDSGCLNRAQLINLPDDDEYQQQQIEQHYCTLPSPASFISSELETSTRLGSEERDYERNSVSIRPAGALMHGGLFASPVDWNQTRGFFAEFTNLSDGLTVHVFPHLEGHTHRIARMSESVQSTANQQEELVRWQASLVEIGSACLAPYRADGLYYRAIIVAIYDDTKEVGVLYVDYLNRDNVPISELRKCPLSVRAVPLRNAEVQLCGVRPNPRLRQDDIGRRMMEVLVRPFYVRIVSTNRAEPDGTVRPEVQFYTDYDCNTLAYQKMIEEKYFYSTKS